MKLPNAQCAIIAIEKLRDYCLNADHPRGKHKARVFRSALGLTSEDAEWLQEEIAKGILDAECVEVGMDQFGQYFVVDLAIDAQAGGAEVRTNWIIREAEDFPRLTSSYVR